MSARNMAGPLVVPVNPAGGRQVIMSPFSGPAGSPFDNDSANNNSTGALNTGIGFGLTPVFGPPSPQATNDAGFDDDYVPGVTLPNGTLATTAILTAIGGGRSGAAVNGAAPTTPFSVAQLLAFGGGASRDAGGGAGFGTRSVIAPGPVAIGAVVEAGFTNRSDRALVAGQTVFGSAVVAAPVPV